LEARSPVIKGSRDTVQSPVQLSLEESVGIRLKRTAVVREERWTSEVASSRRKIYQLEVL
jgi:hypothetical protein